jgi:PAS domain S-box-containing protein
VKPPRIANEDSRLQALERYEILDTPAEATYDEIAELAARFCETPTGLVTLIDAKRQWFKARYGFTVAETARSLAFCSHTIAQRDVLVIPDAASDPRFESNALVTGEPRIRFYAGVPLVTTDDHAIGSLAVIDYAPRELRADQCSALRALGNQVVAQLELRRHVADLHREASHAIQRSEALKSALIECAMDCAIAMDHTGRVLEFNPAAERTFGYRRADVIGKELTELIIPPALRERHRAGLRNHLATGQTRNLERRLEITGMRADGSEFPVELSVTRVATSPPVFAGFLRDLTDRKRAEAQLLQSQKLEAIGQLAGGIAHDFNNILTVMQCNAYLLDSSKPRDEPLAEIMEAIERAASLTRQLLLVSSKQALRSAPVDVDEVVRSMARMLRRVLGEHVSLRTHHHGSLPRILGDAGMLEQVLLNLAVNARDAMPAGGTLSITTDLITTAKPTSVHGLDAAPGRYVTLQVQDTGQGIPPEILPKIFDPFFTTKEVGKGTGLGLATVFGVVKHHHGWIDVHSAADGTSFTIYLPATTLTSDVATHAAQPIVGGNETILLVEDDELVRRQIVSRMREWGYTVLDAASGPRALEIWASRRAEIDLVVTDIIMPEGMTGTQLAEQLRADRPSLPILYTSGYAADQQPSDEPFVIGFNYLEKPYSPADLARAIRRRLADRQAR